MGTQTNIIRHTIHRAGAYHYNRRNKATGQIMRLKLSVDPEEAERLSLAILERLDDIWQHNPHAQVDLKSIVHSLPKAPDTLSSWAKEYLAMKAIDPAPTRTAVDMLTNIIGDKDVREYSRADARGLVSALHLRGLRSGTIRRRIVSICAVVNFAFRELEHDRRNPFSGLLIPKEGKDKQERLPFTTDQLREAYKIALCGKSRVRLCVPILGETGCRIAEVIGLRKEDVDLKKEMIRVRPHPYRSLKTSGSERDIPLVGVALEAAQRLMIDNESPFLFPEYIRESEGCMATHASNAVNKWLKRDFGGRTAHCLRHAFRDRLRAVECPLEMIDALGGWSSVGTAGSRYGQGFDLAHKRKWLVKMAIGVMN